MAKKKIESKFKVYVASEFGSSQELPDFLKDMLEREECTYRVTKPEGALTKKEKRGAQELVKKEFTVQHEGGEFKVPFVSFDRRGKRYFLEVNSLEELFEFVMDYNEYSDCGFTFEKYDPEDDDDAEYLENKFGLEMPECTVMEIKDGVMVLDPEMMEEMDEDFEE